MTRAWFSFYILAAVTAFLNPTNALGCDLPNVDTGRSNQEWQELAEKYRLCVAESEGSIRSAELRLRGDDDSEIHEEMQAAQRSLAEAKANLTLVENAKDFHGLKLGAGIGYTFAFEDRVDEAVVVDDLVRVTSSKRTEPRVFLEAHDYWKKGCFVGKNTFDGCGPFFAISTDGDDLFRGIGLGWMFGKRGSLEGSSGWSIGLGMMLDKDVPDLGDGFEENQAPPGTETTVRLEKKSRASLMLFVANTF